MKNIKWIWFRAGLMLFSLIVVFIAMSRLESQKKNPDPQGLLNTMFGQNEQRSAKIITGPQNPTPPPAEKTDKN